MLTASVLLAGCAAQDTAAPPASTSAAPSPTPSPTASVPASVQCLESGTWVVDNARRAELFAEGLRSAATDVTAEQVGEVTYEFSDGVLTRTFTGSQLTFAAVLDGVGGGHVTETTTLDGTTTAPYEVTETDVVTQAADVTALVVDVVATRDGAPVTFDDPGSTARENEQRSEAWGFTCDGDTLLLADRRDDGTLSETYGTILLHRR